MCPTAKLRGAAMGTRVEDESVEPRPLERRVGRVDGATTPGTEGFGSSDSNIRRNARSTAIAPYGPGSWLVTIRPLFCFAISQKFKNFQF